MKKSRVLVIIFGIIILVVGGLFVGANYMLDSTLDKMTTTEKLDKSEAEINEDILAKLADNKIKSVETLYIDEEKVGPYIRNTLAADKNSNRQEALFDIYRVMRPGEPATYEAADALFNQLFFDSERYDLSAVGRVKMNASLDIPYEDAPDTLRVLRKDDILRIIKKLVSIRDGKGEVDGIETLKEIIKVKFKDGDIFTY